MGIRLTQYSHGAGCGCKISPKILNDILRSGGKENNDPNLLIGNDTRDDAAVYLINSEEAVISTTDFFTPIVDDPFDFGAIAAVNAISDIYAMGGKPLMAVSILGWPVGKLSSDLAAKVLDGARDICRKAGIPLAGGHSIDSTEPIFGLAVTGIIHPKNIKSNDMAEPGCILYLTKPLGVGIITTAQKKNIVNQQDFKKARKQMLNLNDIGTELGKFKGVKAMTDVTGFGLLGHLIEICEASGVSAEINFSKIPLLKRLHTYIAQDSIPGGTYRNFDSYGHKVGRMSDNQKAILCDPQTSGGLLIAVEPGSTEEFNELLKRNGYDIRPIGYIVGKKETLIEIIG